MSSFSSNACYGLSRPDSKKNRIRQPLTNNLNNKKLRKKRGFRRDPIVMLTYFVLVGVLLSGLSSFGL